MYTKRLQITLLNALAKLNQNAFARIFNFANSITRHYPIRITATDNELLAIEDESSTLYISRPNRLRLYHHGITARLDNLLEQYAIHDIPFSSQDLIVDCGANIGEFTTGLQRRYDTRAICIEPEGKELAALQKNVNSKHTHIYHTLLWNEATELNFYSHNESGDSTVFAPKNSSSAQAVISTTLDELLQQDSLFTTAKRIKLLKLEAEGAEPEILQGAKTVLPSVEYITADCGPERGAKHETTLIAVWNILAPLGFRPIAFNHQRTVVVFQNQHI